MPWLNMPEKFYAALFRVAEQDSVRPEEVLVRVLRVLESAYRVRGGQSFVIEEASRALVDGLIPIWFTVPEEFWAQLGRLAVKTGKGEEELLVEGLDLWIRRRDFTLIQPHSNQ
jgi:hypothetical protein